MISHADVEKLLCIQAADGLVLSVYLQVPVDPPALRGLPPGWANCSRWPLAARRARALHGLRLRTSRWCGG